jgi:aminoglycoside phosphotransferase (APT) family kinase protein
MTERTISTVLLPGKIEKVINPRIAKILVEEQFARWAHLPIIPVDSSGWDNITYRLGQKMILRFPSAAPYASQVKKEQKWLPFLATKLPLPIPTPLGLGKPGHSYMWHWSVYNWIDGETAASSQVDKNRLARNLAGFLSALYQVDTKDGPPAGEQNYYRGGKVLSMKMKHLKLLKSLNHIWTLK